MYLHVLDTPATDNRCTVPPLNVKEKDDQTSGRKTHGKYAPRDKSSLMMSQSSKSSPGQPGKPYTPAMTRNMTWTYGWGGACSTSSLLFCSRPTLVLTAYGDQVVDSRRSASLGNSSPESQKRIHEEETVVSGTTLLCTATPLGILQCFCTYLQKQMRIVTHRNCPPCEKPIALNPSCNKESASIVAQTSSTMTFMLEKNPRSKSCTENNWCRKRLTPWKYSGNDNCSCCQ